MEREVRGKKGGRKNKLHTVEGSGGSKVLVCRHGKGGKREEGRRENKLWKEWREEESARSLSGKVGHG